VRRLQRLLSRITVRLLAFNALLVFLPAAGVLFLDTYERQLLADQERSMVAQGRVLAAALSGRGGLRAEEVIHTLVQLDERSGARIRVVNRTGDVLADSSLLGPRREPDSAPPQEDSILERWFYRLGSFPFRLYRKLAPPRQAPLESADVYASGQPIAGPEIQAALAGRYGAATRISSGGQRSVTLYSAIPIRDRTDVVGAVLISQSTFRILQALYRVRVDVFRVFAAALAAAVVLSLLVSTTIARPLVRLRNQAEALLDRRGRLRGRFVAPTGRDEIGDLGRALEQLTLRLEDHIRYVETFASDVSHEFKNPLASIRTATEMLAEVDDLAERRRFLGMVEREVARMEHMLSGVRDITRLDARVEPEEREPVALADLLAGTIESYRLRGIDVLDLAVEGSPPMVLASPDRLTQVFENVLDNAVSFTPAQGRIELRLGRDGGDAVTCVMDEGPGFPEAHLERIFTRFFSYRPHGGSDRRYTGLGLSIAKAIVESVGGSMAARNREGGGACLEIRLPVYEATD
jgi:two-component system sensor histidine kinase ChvG